MLIRQASIQILARNFKYWFVQPMLEFGRGGESIVILNANDLRDFSADCYTYVIIITAVADFTIFSSNQ